MKLKNIYLNELFCRLTFFLPKRGINRFNFHKQTNRSKTVMISLQPRNKGKIRKGENFVSSDKNPRASHLQQNRPDKNHSQLLQWVKGVRAFSWIRICPDMSARTAATLSASLALTPMPRSSSTISLAPVSFFF